MLPAKFGTIWTSGLGEENFWKLRQPELRIVHGFSNGDEMNNKGPPIDASC